MSGKTRIRLSPLFILVIAVIGCDTSPKPVADATLLPADADSSGGGANSGQSTVTEQEAQKFGDAWIRCIAAGDTNTASQLVAWTTICERAIDSFRVKPDFKRGFMKGTSNMCTNMVSTLKANTENGGSYRLVRIVRRGGYHHAVFRLLDNNGAMNYHDLRIVRQDGKICADHFFVAATGEDLGDSLRKVIAPTVSSQTTLGRITGEAQRSMDELRHQQDLAKAVREGRNEEALALYSNLPKELKVQKHSMLYRVMATDIEDEDAYLTAIDEFTEAFPGDASIGLLTLDAAVLRKDMKLLEKSRREIALWSGGDEYIDLLVGGVFAANGEVERAVELTKDIDPSALNLVDAHDIKLAIALSAEDHVEALKQLRTMRDDFGVEFEDLSQAEGFEAFAQSPQYTEWSAGL